ncbi:hypothetical protein FCH28_08430 [Streptomyces piniterrae]|uniref:Uncharacterized protein n=1 Tax=Streptomyces piniterrae TaxID=2571125 RepID=A0A4U0NS52_9ACTN|nr:hypothetical protein [Streptomyces piniterrae]TJZ57429.1 hypothetical protein FCH28_08430 [Streptomyces piniterrae]
MFEQVVEGALAVLDASVFFVLGTAAAFAVPQAVDALQPAVGGPPYAWAVTACAVAYGGTAAAYAVASVPVAGPVVVQPGASATRRSWRTAAVAAMALFVTAVGCGVLALAYPSWAQVWQVASAVSGVASAAAAVRG